MKKPIPEAKEDMLEFDIERYHESLGNRGAGIYARNILRRECREFCEAIYDSFKGLFKKR
ncbi:MAG: hypothetical protein MUP55_00770 [Candidatus Aenigmarchaeota archaeon]|nr:hypothetical protein [Candidatus Aenigmarchaeota archaeon]